jgi:glycosyltransferase involved in cell wall biosynthesis/capsular polysaccharide biosynthesis protein
MRLFVTDLAAGDGDRTATTLPAANTPLQTADPNVESLLQPFRQQSVTIRSIVAVACHEALGINAKDFASPAPLGVAQQVLLLRLVADEDRCPVMPAFAGNGHDGERAATLDYLARKSGELCGRIAGDDLLVLPAPLLHEMMTPLSSSFSFRALVALLPQGSGQFRESDAWKLQRSLFDRGLVSIGSVRIAGAQALCFLAGDAVRPLSGCSLESRGQITISTLAEDGFANQLFRYSFGKLYALRHGLTAAFPAWEGKQLFGLSDKSCEGLAFPRLAFEAFSGADRELWDRENPPIDIDLKGYFQEIPECWRRQRPLLRRLFQLPAEHRHAVDTWHHQVTGGGRRALVAVHLRRGDYRKLQRRHLPWFRIVPEEWYLEWLRTIWSTLSEPLLFVATDEPDAIRPVFRQFETVVAPAGIAPALPDHVRDFEIMRRADYLAICNSSFSRMAAILAPRTQKCFIPSFAAQSFVPYEPWIDPAFWARFANSWQPGQLPGEPPEPAPAMNGKNDFAALPETATLFVDLSDLLLYLLHHRKLSGIQRVQFEMVRNLLEILHPQPIRFVVLDKHGGLGVLEISALLDLIEDFRSDARSRAEIEPEIRALLDRVVPCTVRPRDIVLSLGAFWSVRGMGMLLQKLKNSGVILGLFIHDMLPVTASEYFVAREARMYVKGITEALTFADFLLTTSEYNKSSLAEYIAARKLGPLPVHVVPLGHELSASTLGAPKISSAVAGIVERDYVLCVGTIEARKNPTYLFNIWKMMVQSRRANIPHLVFAGRRGWLVRDFLDQLKACDYLGGRILVLQNVTDAELDLLYRKCLLTMYPSFVEGWGLPVGESLVHGKICLSSAKGGIPEVGGQLVDYIDPYNVSDGLEQLSRYLDEPELRRRREQEIAGQFQPRTWRKAAEDLLRSTQALARQIPPGDGVAAIRLPSNQYLSISSDAIALSTDGVNGDGTLSAELICVSGWHAPEPSGVRAARPAAMIRFRADAAPGTRIHLLLRLAAQGRDFRIRIRSGSGAETEASLADGSERLATLSCAVEPEQLVTAHLSLGGAALEESNFSRAPHWMLRGILYFDPKNAAGEAWKSLSGSLGIQPPASRPAATEPVEQPAPPLDPCNLHRTLLRPTDPIDGTRRAASFGAFLQATNSYWPSGFTADRDAPIFADHADRRTFYMGCGNRTQDPQVGKIDDRIRLIRRSHQFVSMSRFSEGAVFDRSGVSRGFGFLQSAPPEMAPWLSYSTDGLWAAEESLAAAPGYDESYLIFYNGNLHNYYHWLVEGLLPLDILSRALGHDSNLRIAIPKTIEINALIDHREALRAVGLDEYETVEAAANLIKVREAIWVDRDLVECMPALYLRDFRQRIAARYAGLRSPRNRRLLVARKGPTRKIHNLEQVQAFLSRYDFETVYLEGMSMADQILLFQSAEFVVAAHGAGLANLLFCEPGTKVIELVPAVEMRPFFWLISEKLDLVHGMQFCTPVAEPKFQAAIHVDIGKLQALYRMVDAHLPPQVRTA